METERTTSGSEGAVVAERDAEGERLAGSAQGWHRIQLAVLGFIGLCGVLQGGGGSRPGWLEELAGWLGVAALVLACLAIYLVGKVAWPVREPARGAPAGEDDLGRGSGTRLEPGPLESRARLLRLGIALTYVATAVMALAALSNWWPATSTGTNGSAEAGLVRVSAADGRSWCGSLDEAATGSLRIVTGGAPVDLQGATITEIVSVDRC